MEIDYLTRDGKGKEFVKKVKIKEFPTVDHAFVCLPYSELITGGIER